MYSLLEFPPLVQSGGMWIEDFMKSICETLHIVFIEILGSIYGMLFKMEKSDSGQTVVIEVLTLLRRSRTS